MADKERPGAGLSYAPPLRDFTEITEAGTNFDVRELAFYQELEKKRTFRARFTLLAIIFLMLATNILVANRNHQEAMAQNKALLSALIENLDQARLDQAQLNERVESRLEGMENRKLEEPEPAEPEPEAAAD